MPSYLKDLINVEQIELRYTAPVTSESDSSDCIPFCGGGKITDTESSETESESNHTEEIDVKRRSTREEQQMTEEARADKVRMKRSFAGNFSEKSLSC